MTDDMELAFKYAQAAGELRATLLCLVLSIDAYVLPHMADDDWRKDRLLADYERAKGLLDKHRESTRAFLAARDLSILKGMH